MKRLGIKLFIITLGLVFSTSVFSAELAKEGSGEIRGGKSGSVQVLNLGEGRNQMNWQDTGVILDAPENSPFYHATTQGMGTLHGIDGNFKVTGGVVWTRPNGDQFFGVGNGEGVHGKGVTSGSAKIVGGTGECAGIEGEVIATPRPQTKSSKKGTYQSIILQKVKWKIP